MRKIQIKDVWLFVAQVLLLSLVLLSPGLISYITSNDATVVWDSLKISAYWLAPTVTVYLITSIFVFRCCGSVNASGCLVLLMPCSL